MLNCLDIDYINHEIKSSVWYDDITNSLIGTCYIGSINQIDIEQTDLFCENNKLNFIVCNKIDCFLEREIDIKSITFGELNFLSTEDRNSAIQIYRALWNKQ